MCISYGEVPYGERCSGKEAEPQFPHLYGDKTSSCTSLVRMEETHQTGLGQALVVVVVFSLFFHSFTLMLCLHAHRNVVKYKITLLSFLF